MASTIILIPFHLTPCQFTLGTCCPSLLDPCLDMILGIFFKLERGIDAYRLSSYFKLLLGKANICKGYFCICSGILYFSCKCQLLASSQLLYPKYHNINKCPIGLSQFMSLLELWITLKPLQVPKRLHHSHWNPNVYHVATITTLPACLYAGGSLGN